MLVKFKRDFFGADGVLYPKGTREYNGDLEKLPSDAVVVSESGSLPVHSNTPKAGFGAKPLEEQVLDLIPGAGETHQIEPAGGNAAGEPDKKAEAVEKKEVEAGVKAAEAAAERVKEASDPVFAPKKK